MDIVMPEDLPYVTMIGAGGIGSFTALALAKMGVENMTIYDYDKVEIHNLPNQLYGAEYLGEYKVTAAAEACAQFADVTPETRNSAFGKDDERVYGVVISGVDSMEAREAIWKKVKYKPSIPLYIDARMGAEVIRIYTINPCDPDEVEFYQRFLYSDKNALEERCTAKAIIYTGFAVASLLASQVKKYAKREPLSKEIIFDLRTLTLFTQ